MGSCLSKRKASASSKAEVAAVPTNHLSAPQRAPDVRNSPEETQLKEEVIYEKKLEKPKESLEDDIKPPRAEVFLVKHRKSNDDGSRNVNASPIDSIPSNIRTSSCTKEEVDAILIHCGRLSRSNSAEKIAFSGSRKYSGSKRSYDFEDEPQTLDLEDCDADADANDERGARRERLKQRAQRQHSPGGGTQGRRRTPSREREQRSGSKERVSGSTSRRVSRSPGRRSDSSSIPGVANNPTLPMKIMSVPATVAVDKPTEANSTAKRVQVKKTIAGASPRSMSPARAGNTLQQPQALSRNSSRKGDHSPSPYRRNPLSEIDTNTLQCPQNKFTIKKQAAETKEQADETLKPNGITRCRSNRRSRDLDDENPSSAYTNLLLEDIENFHQKNAAAQFNLPACLNKACSILEAVADLNSATGFEEKRRGPAVEADRHKYVTLRERKRVSGEEGEGQESSGSNSVAGGHVAGSWGSSWESSADSTDRWSSRSNGGSERSKGVASQRLSEEEKGPLDAIVANL